MVKTSPGMGEGEKAPRRPGDMAILDRARRARKYAEWKGYTPQQCEDFANWAALQWLEGKGLKQELHEAVVDFLRELEVSRRHGDLLKRGSRVDGLPEIAIPPVTEVLEVQMELESERNSHRRAGAVMAYLKSKAGLSEVVIARAFGIKPGAVQLAIRLDGERQRRRAERRAGGKK